MIQDDVMDVASRYLQRVRRVGGENISAVCPFHSKVDGSYERNPSFSMSLTKGVWHCWSCKASGTLQSFLVDVGLPRAVVVGQYGGLIEAVRNASPGPQFDPTRPAVFGTDPLPESLLGLFDKCPLYMVDPEYAAMLDPDDPVVFDQDLLRRHDVGFDVAHERITFPLRDLGGALVGVSGRTVVGENPRYKVYDREYAALGYDARAAAAKGSLLWNAHRVYPGTYMGPPGQMVLVVEGFRSCLWAIQCGIQNTVALMGSHMSREQQWVLERMGARVYLMLDNDEAGRRALEGYDAPDGRHRRGIAEMLKKSLDVSVVCYGTKQPTQMSPGNLTEAVVSAPDYFRWAMQRDNNRKNMEN